MDRASIVFLATHNRKNRNSDELRFSPEQFPLEDQIVIALRRISQAIDVWSRKLWQDYGLTSPQLAMLRELLAGKNVSPGTLATALHLSQPTVTGILGRLEKAAWCGASAR